MQELTFETILRLPQMELKKTLKAELKSRGYPITDKPGYLYAEGTIPVLLVAHMDTVHRQPVEQICYSADGAVAMSPQGIGGDDRCGVWMILQILRTTNCHVLFCEDEEVGCISMDLNHVEPGTNGKDSSLSKTIDDFMNLMD